MYKIIATAVLLIMSSATMGQISSSDPRINSTNRISRINGVAVDSKGQLVVSDGDNNRISIYNALMERVATSLGDGTPQGVFHFPGQPFVTSEGTILVPDRLGGRILKFSSDGVYQKSFTGENVALDQPMQVVEDQLGILWIANSSYHQLRRLRSDGSYLNNIGQYGRGDGQFRYVGGVALLHSGEIVASDVLNNRLTVLNNQGLFIRQIDVSTSGVNIPHPGIIHVGSDGSMWVISGQRHSVVHLSASGDRLGEISYSDLTGLSLPNPVSVATIGNELLIADGTLNQLLRFDTSGTYLGSLFKRTGDPERIDFPHSAATAANGEIWVADSGNHRLSVYASNGVLTRTVGGFGDEDGKFQNPRSVSIRSDGQVLVADTANHRIQVINQDGTFVRSFGKTLNASPDLNFPEQAIWATDGTIWVVDTSNSCIKHYAEDGTFINKFGSAGSAEGELLSPESIAIAPNGDIIVADTCNHRVQRFTSAGTFVGIIASVGAAPGQVVLPTGLVVTRQGQLLVSDKGNHRVQLFDIAGPFRLEFGTFGDGLGQFHSPELLVAGLGKSVLFADSGTNIVGNLLVDVDATAPGSNISFFPVFGEGWSKTDITATITAVDNDAGVREIRYAINGGIEQSALTNSVAFAITNNGITTVSYYSIDNDGNVEATRSAAVRIDKVNPTTISSALGDTVTLIGADQHSGISSTWYAIDDGVGQLYSIPFKVNGFFADYWSVDAAGNVEARNRVHIRPSISSVSVSPKAVVGGATLTGSIHLTIPAGPQGAVVTLASSSTRALTVPKSVFVAAGETTANFQIQTNVVTASGKVTVTAKTGTIARTDTVLVAMRNPDLLSVTSGKPAIMSGRGTAVNVMLRSSATVGGAIVKMTSSHPLVIAVPTTVSIAQGASRTAFMAHAGEVSEPTIVTITATMDGLSKSVDILVNPIRVIASVTLAPSTVKGGESSVGFVVLNGVTAEPVVVVLTSSNITAAKVFTSVKVPAGARSVTFPVSTLRQTSTKTSVIAAKTGVVQATVTMTVTK